MLETGHRRDRIEFGLGRLADLRIAGQPRPPQSGSHGAVRPPGHPAECRRQVDHAWTVADLGEINRAQATRPLQQVPGPEIAVNGLDRGGSVPAANDPLRGVLRDAEGHRERFRDGPGSVEHGRWVGAKPWARKPDGRPPDPAGGVNPRHVSAPGSGVLNIEWDGYGRVLVEGREDNGPSG